MSDRFNSGHLGDWVTFCDICGQKCYASEATRLNQNTGRGELIVCRHDIDTIDYGTIPYAPRRERLVDWVRPGDTDTNNSAPIVDLETMAYIYPIVMSQNGSIITLSQSDTQIVMEVKF